MLTFRELTQIDLCGPIYRLLAVWKLDLTGDR